MPDIIGIPEEKRPTCRLSGEDGNAFAIMGRVSEALRKAGLHEEAKQFRKEAMAGDYDHLLCVATSYVRDGDPDRKKDAEAYDDDDEGYEDCCEDCGMALDECDC